MGLLPFVEKSTAALLDGESGRVFNTRDSALRVAGPDNGYERCKGLGPDRPESL